MPQKQGPSSTLLPEYTILTSWDPRVKEPELEPVDQELVELLCQPFPLPPVQAKVYCYQKLC